MVMVLYPTRIGSATATTCMTPAASRRATRWRTAASEMPSSRAIRVNGRRPSAWSAPTMRASVRSISMRPLDAFDSCLDRALCFEIPPCVPNSLRI